MNYSITEKLDENLENDLFEMFKQEWWTSHRKKEDIKIMLENSDIVIGVFNRYGLIGFARVLSDFIYKAEIFDIIVKKDFRGMKIGKLLIETVLNHPKLKRVEQFNLQCLKDVESFYEKYGFKTLNDELLFMRRKRL